MKNSDKRIKPARSGGALLSVWIFVVVFFTGCAGLPRPGDVPEKNNTADVLKVGVSCNAPPLIFKENKKITGFEAEMAGQFAEYIGRRLEFVEVPWEDQLEYLEQGKTDIIMSGMSITSARNYRAVFSTPYLRSGQIMLVRMEDYQKFSNGITSVMNTSYRIGTVANTTGDLLITSTINNAQKTKFKNSLTAVKSLIENEIDVFVYDAPMVCYYASLYQQQKLVPVLKMATEEFIGWAMRKDDNVLLNSANEFLKTISSNGQLERSLNKWIPYLGR